MLGWRMAALGAGGAALIALVAAARAQRPEPPALRTPPPSAAAPNDPDSRRVFFGELHLHTTMSFDAWTFGTKITPDEAYRFARGETVMVPPAQLMAEQGIRSDRPVPARRAWPLDFAAVTDHSEYIGAVAQLEDPDSAFSKTPFGRSLKEGGRGAFLRAGEAIRGVRNETTAALAAAARAADGWNVEIRAANANYRPGRFTTLIGYEWTSSPGRGVHMHRNVLFAGDSAPAPFTSVDSSDPEDLWRWMAGVRAKGFDVLAIPHNPNLSDGLEFNGKTWKGEPIDKAYALARALNEPLIEIAQNKGTSETAPGLSPNDEFAGFEIMDRIYAGQTKSTLDGSFVRQGYGRGLEHLARLGANPYKLGVVGGSDIHNGLTVSDEAGSGTAANGYDPRTMSPLGPPLRRALGETDAGEGVRPSGQRENDPLQSSSAALTGVWAEENTRASIFAALKRRETFATSGTRIRVRVFGSWGFTPALLRKADWVSDAYAVGAPMGGELPARPRGAGAPRFIVQASKDPTGPGLERIQMVKVWLDGDRHREKVFDVSRPATRVGAASISTHWTDPEFDPRSPAAYYVRVLERPTPRWSTILARRNGRAPPKGVPETIQERAWTSPIWYTPG